MLSGLREAGKVRGGGGGVLSGLRRCRQGREGGTAEWAQGGWLGLY